jgi:hypothetical protein
MECLEFNEAIKSGIIKRNDVLWMSAYVLSSDYSVWASLVKLPPTAVIYDGTMGRGKYNNMHKLQAMNSQGKLLKKRINFHPWHITGHKIFLTELEAREFYLEQSQQLIVQTNKTIRTLSEKYDNLEKWLADYS